MTECTEVNGVEKRLDDYGQDRESCEIQKPLENKRETHGQGGDGQGGEKDNWPNFVQSVRGSVVNGWCMRSI